MIGKVVAGILLSSTIMIAGNLPQDKHWGVGIHIAPLPSVSASYYLHKQSMELELDTAYDEEFQSSWDKGVDIPNLETYTTDLHLRKYHDGQIGGLYFSGFLRFSYQDGLLKEDFYAARNSKLGIGVGIGYRTFQDADIGVWYWSIGLNAGLYVVGENDIYRHDDLFALPDNDRKEIFNVDLLKFGYIF